MLHLGRTAHSRFKIPVDKLTLGFTCNVKKQSDTAKFLSNVSLAIINKRHMLHKLCYDEIGRTMRDMVEKKSITIIWWKSCIDKWWLAPDITCCS